MAKAPEGLTVYLYIEDFDDCTLDEWDRKEQLRDAVKDYNALYGTTYDPEKTYHRYQKQQSKYDM